MRKGDKKYKEETYVVKIKRPYKITEAEARSYVIMSLANLRVEMVSVTNMNDELIKKARKKKW